MKNTLLLALLAILLATTGTAEAGPKDKYPRGLNPDAAAELAAVGVNKYAGMFEPAASIPYPEGWTKHTFDPAGGDGPICIAGTQFSVFTKAKNPSRVLIMLQGGGACWEGFYNCNILAESQEPPAPQVGIWDETSGLNPLEDWSVVYMPYCDGSVFTGDNAVVDPNFPFGPVRFHRGLRNLTAGIDVAKSMFPNAGRILVAGSSAGGVGATAFAPFLVRMAYGNNKKVMVFNDAGPVAVNLADTAAIAARAKDWKFGQFYPPSCTDCSDQGQSTALIRWRLENDNTIREAFYSTDGDTTNRFFLNLLPPTAFRDAYRGLLDAEHGAINALYPDRYKRYIRSDDTSHTGLQNEKFYESANGIPLFEWLDDFLVPRPFWTDNVEDYVPGFP
ncbi:MAG: pectin acetylesterase-family hydrolase [Woeseiaceae bacterium]|jgi:hypothetical protein|nr:pectin acetylesterase-family hydrolase [Woeseiaceae bacterium]